MYLPKLPSFTQGPPAPDSLNEFNLVQYHPFSLKTQLNAKFTEVNNKESLSAGI